MTAAGPVNEVLHGDNLVLLRQLPDGHCGLIYADPPFGTQRDWGEFDDRWQGGLEGYMEWMRPRLRELGRVLAATGSLYLHCDPTASHLLRVELDQVLGRECWENEIVWRRAPGRSMGNRWGRVTDRLLYYRRPGGCWVTEWVPHRPEYVADHYRNDSGTEGGGGRRNLTHPANGERRKQPAPPRPLTGGCPTN